MPNPHRHLTTRPIDFWMARGAVVVIAGLQIGIVNDLTVGPRWLAPCLELALLIPLSLATAWTQKRARKASTDEQWNLVGRDRRMVRRLAVFLTAVSTLMNFGALARLIAAIMAGHAGGGRTLLLDAINIWATNVIIFALWFWALDRGGPAARGLVSEQKSDFLFTQQQTTVDRAQFPNWSPGFIDYLFLAFTNATAFSPADTFPLTVRAKLLMMAESAISLATIALVASRAVGILS
jgi:predicted permease